MTPRTLLRRTTGRAVERNRDGDLDRATSHDSWGDPERGSGTVLVVGLVGVVVALTAALGLVAATHHGRAVAQAGADLGALAAASGLSLPPGFTRATGPDVDPCALAATVAARNGARVTACEPRPAGDVVVRTSVSTPMGTATATARAGPAHLRQR